MFSQLAKRSTRMLVIGIFQELRAFVVVSDALRKESFLLQMKYAMSASVEIILFRAYLIILVKIERNDGKLLQVKTSPLD